MVRTRIPFWLLEQARRLGSSEQELLEAYPTLRAEDLVSHGRLCVAMGPRSTSRLTPTSRPDGSLLYERELPGPDGKSCEDLDTTS